MKVAIKKSELLEGLEVAKLVQRQLLEALNEREELKQTVKSITSEHSKRKRRVSDLEETLRPYKSKGYPPGDDAPSKSDFAYWRGAAVYEDLEAAKKALLDWEKDRMPAIGGIETQLQKLEPVIATLKEELESFVIISAEEIPEPIYNPNQKLYKLPAGWE